MSTSFQEKIEKYRIRFITPTSFYTKNEKGNLKRFFQEEPTITHYALFYAFVLKELFFRVISFRTQ